MIPSFVMAILVALVSSNIYLSLKRRYPLAADFDWNERGERDTTSACVHVILMLWFSP